MNNQAIKEVLNELFSHLERLETQSEAILQFLKEKKRVTDKQLAPYLEQAANASNVKWRAARVRIDHLLEPEHPEEETKLSKKPELHEGPSSAEKRNGQDGKEDRRVESVDGESKRTGDQKKIESSDKDARKAESANAEANGDDLSKAEKPLTVGTTQARPAEGKEHRAEERSELQPRNVEQQAQEQREQKAKSDDHPVEGTEAVGKREGAEPAAQLKPEKKSSGKEAA